MSAQLVIIMKFIVTSGELQKALNTVSGVISSSQSRPILENFLFELENNLLKITASDGETTLLTSLAVKSESNGKIAVPAKMFQDAIKTFGDQPLTFLVKPNENGGGILEILDEKDNYFIALDNAEEYPELAEFNSAQKVTISSGILAEALSKTLFATSNDTLRPVMTGVFFQFGEEEANFVATDSHRLVVYKRTDIKNSEPMEFIMPKKPLNILKGILAGSETEVTVEYNESNAKFSFDDMEFICRLIDGKYPNYDAVIPKENPNKLILNRSQFYSSINRLSLFSNKTTHQVRLKVAGSSLVISAEDVDYSNKGEERFTCNYQGDDLEIGFNSKFLKEMINNLDSDEILIEMSLPNRAGLITPVDGLDEGEKVLMLAMPIMLNNNQ